MSLSDKLTNGDLVTERRIGALLQGLHLCQEAWNPGSPWDRQGAQAALWGRPPGVSPSHYLSCFTHVLFCVFSLCLGCLRVEAFILSLVCTVGHISLVSPISWFPSYSISLFH